MRTRRSHVVWGLSLSLALHLGALAALALVPPRLHVRPGAQQTIELAVVHTPPKAALPTPAMHHAARTIAPEPVRAPAPQQATDPARRKPARASHRATRRPKVPPAAASVQSTTPTDPRSDGSTLQRVLQKIAATDELTQDQRRKAMLVVLRSWEHPDGLKDAQRLVDGLIQQHLQDRRSPTRPDAAVQ